MRLLVLMLFWAFALGMGLRVDSVPPKEEDWRSTAHLLAARGIDHVWMFRAGRVVEASASDVASGVLAVRTPGGGE